MLAMDSRTQLQHALANYLACAENLKSVSEELRKHAFGSTARKIALLRFKQAKKDAEAAFYIYQRILANFDC